ncbi:MAG: 4-(cytidine 5'-diphospho)-2-C-methyl-D-erythritol kinase [Candidatus Firestonebacteria bacterium RIFOXYA2_FULL_40_8]|nr:MAG: 4-(cytidine 5'-diphospho)-2-C-methyl-D-erythritol kinase [Candidatus Firestonebacteria bacterium RIFOXYA2_FULL_40_8]
MTLKSFAKLNFYLEVKGKRPDGYHNIKTLFQTIDLYDELSISKEAEGISITCDHPEIPTGDTNIAYKAAEIFLQENKVKSGLHITIKKNIPVTAGLGGGSSNAAAVLSGCKKLFDIKCSDEKLSVLALSLGSDVPFFLKGVTAVGEGRGEILTKLNPVAETWLVLVVEGEKPSTGKIYSEFTNTLTNPEVFDKKLEEFKLIKCARGGDLAKILYNDLETPAGKFFPVLFEVKKALLAAGALGALMSGSGPTVFGIAESKSKAEEIAAKLSTKYKRTFITKTINESTK